MRRPAAARVSLGLDQPFAIRFGTWAFAALQGDLGNSLFSGQSIVSMIAQRIPPTLSLMILTLLISVSVAVPLGVVAAARQGSWTDRVGLPSPYWAFRQQRNVVLLGGATDAAQPSERMISR